MTRLALFDLDNTLVDRQSTYRRWAAAVIDRFGLGLGELEWLCAVDDDGFASREDVFGPARARWGLTQSVPELIEQYRTDYPSFFVPDPLVNDALVHLRHGGWTIGIVTNGPTSQNEKIERAGLVDVVTAWCISDEVGAAKPDARIFEEALLRCGVDPEQPGRVVMIGDTPVPDIGGGRAMGFQTIWIHRGRRWPLTDYRPDGVAASVPDAVALLLEPGWPPSANDPDALG
jgi:FMN phosphatase YigB (HAD superfamily)